MQDKIGNVTSTINPISFKRMRSTKKNSGEGDKGHFSHAAEAFAALMRHDIHCECYPRFGCHAQYLAVEAKVKAWIEKTNPLFCHEPKKNKITSFSLSEGLHYTLINNSPLVSILYPSNNTL